ncbi:hypothetical protein [Pseudanabaena sp. FACHB-2040]|nr:hypothetical protein [Pseudanabaena sp. FACHB-2040]MBD0269096.1 hypothetical protein [Cyanobacteria bacterium Co-bin8]MBD2258653.1 hypothetical protein [Pseudanabaena sp. FACHB-2040]
MNVPRMIDSVIQYFSEAVVRIFGPNSDSYPATGVQPFDGEPFSERVDER